MSKLLLFGLVVLVIYLLVRGKFAAKRAVPPDSRPAEEMVICAHCGVHLPCNESLTSGRHHFCCEQHRGLGPVDRKF